MKVTIILGSFSVLFAYIAKYKNARWGLKVSFTLIFLFLALRYNFGNDYKVYLDAFIGIAQNNQIDLFDKTQQFEMGWMFLNWLFRYLGFFAMIAVLALINCIVYYRFIKKYVPAKYYWLAIFLYIFSPGFMLIHSSAMRQSVAINLFILSIDYLIRKDPVRYFLFVGLASLFHFSALILFPLYLLAIFNWKTSKINGAILVAAFASLIFYGKTISPHLYKFINKYFQKYSQYEDPGVVGTGLGFIFISAMLILTLYYEKYQNRGTALLFKIAIISFMIMPMNLVIELIGRLGMYFSPVILAVYPIILINLRKPVSKILFFAIICIFTIYGFFQFFYSDIYKDYLIYKTILLAPHWY